MENSTPIMDKLPKFVIAKNPMIEGNRIFIIHMREPAIHAEVFHFNIDNEPGQMEAKARYAAGSSTEVNNEYIVIGAVYIAPTDLNADKLAGIMRRMADWYRSVN